MSLNGVKVLVEVNGEILVPLVMNHSKANVTDVDSIIIPSNAERKYLLIVNNSDTDMIINLGNAITEDKGIPLNAGANYQISKDYLFAGEIHAIHKAAGMTKALDITEGV